MLLYYTYWIQTLRNKEYFKNLTIEQTEIWSQTLTPVYFSFLFTKKFLYYSRAHTHTQIDTHIHTYKYTYAYIRTHTHEHTYTHTKVKRTTP